MWACSLNWNVLTILIEFIHINVEQKRCCLMERTKYIYFTVGQLIYVKCAIDSYDSTHVLWGVYSDFVCMCDLKLYMYLFVVLFYFMALVKLFVFPFQCTFYLNKKIFKINPNSILLFGRITIKNKIHFKCYQIKPINPES